MSLLRPGGVLDRRGRRPSSAAGTTRTCRPFSMSISSLATLAGAVARVGRADRDPLLEVGDHVVAAASSWAASCSSSSACWSALMSRLFVGVAGHDGRAGVAALADALAGVEQQAALDLLRPSRSGTSSTAAPAPGGCSSRRRRPARRSGPSRGPPGRRRAVLREGLFRPAALPAGGETCPWPPSWGETEQTPGARRPAIPRAGQPESSCARDASSELPRDLETDRLRVEPRHRQKVLGPPSPWRAHFRRIFPRILLYCPCRPKEGGVRIAHSAQSRVRREERTCRRNARWSNASTAPSA